MSSDKKGLEVSIGGGIYDKKQIKNNKLYVLRSAEIEPLKNKECSFSFSLYDVDSGKIIYDDYISKANFISGCKSKVDFAIGDRDVELLIDGRMGINNKKNNGKLRYIDGLGGDICLDLQEKSWGKNCQDTDIENRKAALFHFKNKPIISVFYDKSIKLYMPYGADFPSPAYEYFFDGNIGYIEGINFIESNGSLYMICTFYNHPDGVSNKFLYKLTFGEN